MNFDFSDMNFDFSEEQKLLQKTTRDYLDEHAPLSVCRQVLESDASYSAELWKGAAEMGWLGAAVPESYGGAGFGHLELALIAEELGRALAPIPFSSSVYLATEALLLAGSEAQKERELPRLASGERIGTLGLTERPGRSAPAAIETRFEGGRLTGTKLPVPDGDLAGLAVVLARSEEGPSLVLVDLDAAGVERTALRSIDPSRSQAKVAFDGAPGELLGKAGQGLELASRILDRAAVLTAFEQLGGAQRAFDITREFTLGRYAFDLYVAIELARSNAYYGAWALSHDNEELPAAACGARVSSCDAFELAGKEIIQLHGGVGFTWEYDCHLFYRRAKLLGLTLGSAAEWRDKLIARIDV
jgi:alkylation response protein AidB-like acyl-CoA dehydrogenase